MSRFRMNKNYEVIIIGAGPSGATLAFELANHGVKVLVIDKATFPRYKCCGGGLTFKAATLLGVDVTSIIENSVSGAVLAFSGAGYHRANYGQIIMYTIKRENLDYLLLQKAEKAGAEILQGITFESLSSNDDHVEVSTSDGDYKSQFVIGADGSRSIVASSVNNGGYDDIVGIQTEISVGNKDLEKWQSQVVIDLGRTSDGYAWLFPYKESLSTGIASFKTKDKDLKNGYRQFLTSLGINQYKTVKQSGGIISVCKGRPCVTRGRLALLGDAAGLADPLTGEGLYNAILSAKLATPVIEKALLQNGDNLDSYQQLIDENITPQIETARTFSRILRMIPGKLFNLAKDDDRIWNTACALVKGETTYTAIKERIIALGGLYAILFRN